MAVNNVHELTAGELTLLRTRPHRTQLYMAVMPIMDDSIVYVMRVDGAPASDDSVVEVDYDRDGLGPGVAADWDECLDDMTVYVGTSSGASDVGVVRLRGFEGGSDEDSGTMLIGETSEIEWADNLYLTVINEFNLWPRHIYITDAGDIYMDYDVAYTDQHQYPDPVPVLGPDLVTWLEGASVEVLFDGSNSWSLDGGALTYLWDAPGASWTNGLATATPTIHYDTAGLYRVSCAVTRTYGGGNDKTFTGYRYVWVFDDDYSPISQFNLQSCMGDRTTGGWECTVRMYDECSFDDIVDRAKVIIFARDWYGNTEESVGPIESDSIGGIGENIVVSGWIDGESITFHRELGYVEFAIYGPQHWFGKMYGFPHGIEDYDGAPTSWVEFNDLTLDKGLWSFLHWRTTATRCMDISLTGDDRQIAVFDAPVGTLWEQMNNAARDTILAQACCDRYGRLFIEHSINLTFDADRVGLVTVMEILRQDWQEEIGIERRDTNEYSMLDISGVYYQDGSADPFFSLSRGHVYSRYGTSQVIDKLAMFDNQATNNSWAGLIFEAYNNVYPNVDVRMSGNYRVFDVCPRMRVDLSIEEDDTKRGIEWSHKHLCPKSLDYTHYPEYQQLYVSATFEAETGEGYGITGDPPIEPPPPDDTPPPPPPPPPPPAPEYEGWPTKVYFASQLNGVYYTDDFSGVDDPAQPTWTAVNTGLTDLNVASFGVDPTEPDRYQYCHCDNMYLHRRVDGGNWTTIMDPAAAQALTGVVRTYLYGLAVDKVNGTLYLWYFNKISYSEPYVLYSTDHGDTWSFNALSGAGLIVDFGPIVAYNDILHLWHGYYRQVLYSSDHFATWAAYQLTLGGVNYWNYLDQDPHSPMTLMLTIALLDPGKVVVPVSTTNLNPLPTQGDMVGSVWFSTTTPNFIRMVRNTGIVYVTTDWWATWTESPGEVFPHLSQIYAPVPSDEDKIIVANYDLGITYTHAILVMDGDTDITPQGKGGNMTNAAPYTDSIPNNCGKAANNGIQAVG